jgi:5-methylcytosine-specific restriction endonuclease McrA
MAHRVRTHTRRFEAERKAFFAQCRARHDVCWLCGMPIDYEAAQNTTDDSYNLDHYFPVSKSPDLQEDPAGFRPSHTSCNNLRGNRDPAKPLGTLSRQWIQAA